MFGVAVLSFNHPHITEKCLLSTLKLVEADRVMLLHNGSKNEFKSELNVKFKDIFQIETLENRGFSGGANLLLTSAFEKWDWVLFLTNDTTLESVDFELHLLPGLFVPKVYLRKRERVDYEMGGFDSRRAQLRHFSREQNWHLNTKSGIYTYAPGTAFLIHRKVFQDVGPFDETLHTYWEDVDFSVRCHQLGFAPQSIQGIELIHAGGKTTRKDRFYTNFLFQRNRQIVSMRYCTWWYKPILFFNLQKDRARRFWRSLDFSKVMTATQ